MHNRDKTAEVTKDGTAEIKLTNTYTQNLGSLKLTKTSNGHDTPADAEFTITGPNDYSQTVKYSEFTDGSITLDKLLLGTYSVKEDNADVNGYTLVVTGDNTADVAKGETAEIALTNTYTQTSVKVSKVDIADGKELEGALIQVLDKEGNVVEEWDSTKEAHEIEGLKTGEEYTLRETVAPEGYSVTTDTHFTIDETGKVTSGDAKIREDGVILVQDSRIEESSSETETSTEIESSSETETSTEIESSSETETSTEIESSSETETSTEIESSSETETSTEIESSSETETSTEIESGSETETSTETESSTEIESSSETETSTETQATTAPTTSGESAIAETTTGQTVKILGIEDNSQTIGWILMIGGAALVLIFAAAGIAAASRKKHDN